jgi:transcriptional regulator with XRE-family HTH domain
MNDRMLKLRKFLKLRQKEMANKLGITHSSISKIESGKTPLTEANIRLICFTFGLNEAWLRTGEGTMFAESSGPEERELLHVFDELTPEGRKMVLEYAELILKNEKAFRGEPPETAQEAPKQAPGFPQETETEESIAIRREGNTLFVEFL